MRGNEKKQRILWSKARQHLRGLYTRIRLPNVDTRTIHNTDAGHCPNYETVKDSASYFIGFQDGRKSNTNQYVIDRLHDLINSLEEGEKGSEGEGVRND